MRLGRSRDRDRDQDRPQGFNIPAKCALSFRQNSGSVGEAVCMCLLITRL